MVHHLVSLLWFLFALGAMHNGMIDMPRERHCFLQNCTCLLLYISNFRASCEIVMLAARAPSGILLAKWQHVWVDVFMVCENVARLRVLDWHGAKEKKISISIKKITRGKCSTVLCSPQTYWVPLILEWAHRPSGSAAGTVVRPRRRCAAAASGQ